MRSFSDHARRTLFWLSVAFGKVQMANIYHALFKSPEVRSWIASSEQTDPSSLWQINRFGTWAIASTMVLREKLQQSLLGHGLAVLVLHDDSEKQQRHHAKLRNFSTPREGLLKYHQILLERSLCRLFAADPAQPDPFAESLLREMCCFTAEDNTKFQGKFGSVCEHLDCLNDTSVVRFVYGRQRLTNQMVMLRFDVYTSDVDDAVCGVGPRLGSERAHKGLVR